MTVTLNWHLQAICVISDSLTLALNVHYFTVLLSRFGIDLINTRLERRWMPKLLLWCRNPQANLHVQSDNLGMGEEGVRERRVGDQCWIREWTSMLNKLTKKLKKLLHSSNNTEFYIFTSHPLHLCVYYKLTKSPAPSWLDSSVSKSTTPVSQQS